MQATFCNEYSSELEQHDYDQVIVETGTIALDNIYQDLVAKSVNQGQFNIGSLLTAESQDCLKDISNDSDAFALFRIGDCVSARGIHAAVLDATRVCLNI